MSGINLNYQEVIRKAHELEEFSKELKKTCNQLQNIINMSSSNWRGEASNQYIKKVRLLYSKTNTQAKKLSQTANALLRKAEQYKRIEALLGGKR